MVTSGRRVIIVISKVFDVIHVGRLTRACTGRVRFTK